MADLEFKVMNSLFEVGDAYMAELESTREAEKEKLARRKARGEDIRDRKDKRMKGIRETQPW